MQMDPVIRSRRKALREAQIWLLARAREMNDPRARQVLNAAASSFGAEMLRGFNPETGRSDLQETRNANRRNSAIKPGNQKTPAPRSE